MKLIPELVTVVLWGIAAVATATVTSDGGQFTYLAPLFGVCAVGSVLTVRWSKGQGA